MSNIVIFFAILALGCANAQFAGARAGAIAGAGAWPFNGGFPGFPWFNILSPEDILKMQPAPGKNVHTSFMSSSSKGGVTETKILHSDNGVQKEFTFTH